MSADAAAPARSYLFVPGDRPERFDKAVASGADRVVLDLEDAVAAHLKPTARDAVGAWLAGLSPVARGRCVVRINDVSTPWFEADLDMLARVGAAEAMLPKAEHSETVARLLGASPGIAVLALIESARGVLNAEAIASSPGVSRLVFGTLDYALDLDLDTSGEPLGLDHAAGRLALASRAAGLAGPVAGVTPEIDDPIRFAADLARARSHGFSAKLCIHPKQIALLHAALRPGDAELEWARRVLDAAEGQAGAVQVDGRMVDRPVLQRARNVLARASDR
jgi:citrate lyase subunit beta/citryl-CoA lyase